MHRIFLEKYTACIQETFLRVTTIRNYTFQQVRNALFSSCVHKKKSKNYKIFHCPSTIEAHTSCSCQCLSSHVSNCFLLQFQCKRPVRYIHKYMHGNKTFKMDIFSLVHISSKNSVLYKHYYLENGSLSSWKYIMCSFTELIHVTLSLQINRYLQSNNMQQPTSNCVYFYF